MALYKQYGSAIEILGYRKEAGRLELCGRYPDGTCTFAGIEELQADNGLAEIEAAYRSVLGYSPWNRIERNARAF